MKANSFSYQIFVPAIAAERGIEFASLNLWNTYGGLVACVGTLVAAYVVRKVGPKWCMSVALILAGLIPCSRLIPRRFWAWVLR